MKARSEVTYFRKSIQKKRFVPYKKKAATRVKPKVENIPIR